jgi:hypothetical protein
MKMEQIVFRNVGIQQSDAGEIPKRIHTRFKTRRKFEIKKLQQLLSCYYFLSLTPPAPTTAAAATTTVG